MKKIIITIAVVFLIFMLVPNVSTSTFAEDLGTVVDGQVENLDTSGLDDLTTDLESITSGRSFKEIIKDIVSGKYKTQYGSTLNYIIKSFSDQVNSVVPVMILIVVLGVMSLVLKNFRPLQNNNGVGEIISLVCYCVVVIIIVSVVSSVISTTYQTINKIQTQMECVFPILLTLLTATGEIVSVGIYSPLVAILTTGVSMLFSKVFYPLFIVAFVFVIVGHLSSSVKLNKMSGFVNSVFKWGVGLAFTLFAGFLTIQGISASKYDTISLKATRFAMKNAIPIVGGYLSDGLDYVLLSSVLIKNAVGVGGLLILLGVVLVPIIKILLLKLALQFTAGVVEPISDNNISSFCDGVSKVLVYPLIILLSISFMYILTVGLIMCTVAGV